MNCRKILTGLLLLLILLATLGCGQMPPQEKPPQGLVVNIIDVGQGDAILLRTGGQVTLIDTGDVSAREELIGYLKKQNIKVIDNLIITHPHSDHIGGAAPVLENFTVRRVYDSGQISTSALYRNYLSYINNKGIAYEHVVAPRTLDIGDGAELKIISPGATPLNGTDSDLNNNSVVARLVFGEFSLLLTGDAEQEAESLMLKRFEAELRSNVLKAGHHGSRTSSSPAFLKAVNPADVVISVGANNEYHHPHPSTLKKYQTAKYNVYRTDKDGTVTITSDGKTYKISKEK